jgi:hydrogenase maturation factor
MSDRPSGKLPPRELERLVLSRHGADRPEVLLGPAVGEDAAVIRWPEGKLLVVASDPIVGAAAGAGRLLVRVNANDVACKGADPAYLTATLIFPAKAPDEIAARIMAEIDAECRVLGIAVVGGHTEFNSAYDRSVLSATLFGTADRLLSASDIRPGDAILATKHLGIEGMSILAADRPDLLKGVLSEEEIRAVLTWTDSISVVPEARLLRDLARFLHDPTEGGFAGALFEAMRLAGLFFRTDPKILPIHPFTARAAEALGFDPLRLIASGTLLAVLPPEALPEAGYRLAAAGIEAALVGRVTEEPAPEPTGAEGKEELWGLLARPGRP